MKHQPYDLIGDIHGHHAKLLNLLQHLGYARHGSTFRHPAGRKVIFLGDALMAPYELLATSADEPGNPPTSGLHWLSVLREHFPHSIWLNPEAPRGWSGNTIEAVRSVFPMFHLTVDGLTEAVQELTRRR
jgi:uncharacterized protein with von Willebrand factor type A (vWA) domain